jgi:hypothetical protein
MRVAQFRTVYLCACALQSICLPLVWLLPLERPSQSRRRMWAQFRRRRGRKAVASTACLACLSASVRAHVETSIEFRASAHFCKRSAWQSAPKCAVQARAQSAAAHQSRRHVKGSTAETALADAKAPEHGTRQRGPKGSAPSGSLRSACLMYVRAFCQSPLMYASQAVLKSCVNGTVATRQLRDPDIWHGRLCSYDTAATTRFWQEQAGRQGDRGGSRGGGSERGGRTDEGMV